MGCDFGCREDGKYVWVRPELVAVVEFLEWTEGDRLRHSKFVALREDKDPPEVVKGRVAQLLFFFLERQASEQRDWQTLPQPT